eukprot:scaffold97504_cov69-Phaeocystis_antarctica.AAC.3
MPNAGDESAGEAGLAPITPPAAQGEEAAEEAAEAEEAKAKGQRDQLEAADSRRDRHEQRGAAARARAAWAHRRLAHERGQPAVCAQLVRVAHAGGRPQLGHIRDRRGGVRHPARRGAQPRAALAQPRERAARLALCLPEQGVDARRLRRASHGALRAGARAGGAVDRHGHRGACRLTHLTLRLTLAQPPTPTPTLIPAPSPQP